MVADRSRAALAYRDLAAPVLGYLRGLGVPEAEDVLGEVFVQVVRDIGQFHGDDAALRRWVFSLAHNRVMDSHRRARRRPTPIPHPILDVQHVPAPSEPFDAELIAALALLSLDQREVIVLRFVADLPLEGVARITGRTAGAVKALQHRALEHLSRSLSEPSAEQVR